MKQQLQKLHLCLCLHWKKKLEEGTIPEMHGATCMLLNMGPSHVEIRCYEQCVKRF